MVVVEVTLNTVVDQELVNLTLEVELVVELAECSVANACEYFTSYATKAPEAQGDALQMCGTSRRIGINMGTPDIGNMLSQRRCEQRSTGRSTKSLSEIREADGNRLQSVPFVESDGIAKEVVKLLEVETPWQEILADFIKQQVKGGGQTTWRKYNRRLIGSDIYMPSMLDEKAGQMVVAMDTSGSVFSDIDKFLSEFKTIAMDVMPEKVHLVYWDYSVQGEETYDEMSYANLEDSPKPIGGGGTDPSCVFRQVEDKILTGEYQDINAVIIFTDGYFYGDSEGDWEKLGIPVLWAVIERGGNSEFVPTFGSLITIK